MCIINRYTELLAIHERRTGRKWSYEDVAQATGVSTSTLSAYANNKVQRFDAVTIGALVRFFGCGIGDLLTLEETEPGRLLGRAAV